jgi:hypothetical protein
VIAQEVALNGEHIIELRHQPLAYWLRQLSTSVE